LPNSKFYSTLGGRLLLSTGPTPRVLPLSASQGCSCQHRSQTWPSLPLTISLPVDYALHVRVSIPVLPSRCGDMVVVSDWCDSAPRSGFAPLDRHLCNKLPRRHCEVVQLLLSLACCTFKPFCLTIAIYTYIYAYFTIGAPYHPSLKRLANSTRFIKIVSDMYHRSSSKQRVLDSSVKLIRLFTSYLLTSNHFILRQSYATMIRFLTVVKNLATLLELLCSS